MIADWLQPLLPLRAATVTLCFTQSAELPFFHQPALSAFLRHLLDSPPDYDTALWIDAVESGRTRYGCDDHYRFTLFALPDSGERLLELLFSRLRQLPLSARRQGAKLAFRNNLELVALHDLWSQQPIEQSAQLLRWSPLQESEHWLQSAPPYTLRWLTPARILIPKQRRVREGKPLKGEARYCRGDGDLDTVLLLTRLYDGVADLLRRRVGALPERAPTPEVTTESQHQFWIDGNYRDASGKTKVMGGVSGEIRFTPDAPLPELWWHLLILGQYLGIGQRRVFGWGRYRIETDEGCHTLERSQRAQNLLTLAATEENLQQAYQVIREHQRQSPYHTTDDMKGRGEGVHPGRGVDDIRLPDPEWLQWLARTVSSGRWKPSPLTRVVIEKSGGGARQLSIPPFPDRVVQRAVAQLLTPGIDNLLSHQSYGYRRGISRQRAAERISQSWREGYRWVFESDIQHFFDRIQRTHLQTRLYSLYPDDPVVALLLGWVAAPVVLDGTPVERPCGVPQGAPVSPLLTNLLLDDFDSDLEMAGYRMIRFVDDFVVLCKRESCLEQAEKKVRESLSDLGLELNPEKTRYTSFEQGFHYLGYLFLNDMVIESDSAVEPVAQHEDVNGRTESALQQQEPGSAMGELDEHGTLLVVAAESALLTSRDRRLHVGRNKEEIDSIPWNTLSAIVLVGSHHITTPALRKALSKDIPLHFLTRSGHYEGVSWSGRAAAEGSQLWLTQQHKFSQLAMTLPLARSVVIARIRHMREVLRQHSRAELNRETRQQLKREILAAQQVLGNQPLNGVEGSATRRYFEALQQIVPPEYGFSGRNRRPPKDPFNALLSLGYSVLYSHVESMIRVNGLLPWYGFYHQARGRHAALASDLMEPFRHLVERTALQMVQRNILKPEDFTSDALYGTHLNSAGRRRYLQQLEQRFLQPVHALGADESGNLHQQLYRQGRSLVEWLRGRGEFTPFVMR